MPAMDRRTATLLVVDVQSRLMPAIHEGETVLARIRTLMAAADLLGVPVVMTEQNPDGLGATMPDLSPGTRLVRRKTHFDACRETGFVDGLRRRPTILLAGCEAHVCVLQTALGLVAAGFPVYLAADAVGSRRPDSKETALRRLAAHGVEIVTAETAVFEWLESSDHPRFKAALALVK